MDLDTENSERKIERALFIKTDMSESILMIDIGFQTKKVANLLARLQRNFTDVVC